MPRCPAHLPDSHADFTELLTGRRYGAVGLAGPSAGAREGFQDVAELA